ACYLFESRVNVPRARAENFPEPPTRSRSGPDQRLIVGRLGSQTIDGWRGMSRIKTAGAAGTDPWDSFEPYVQLIRSLLPRAASVALFDTNGDLRWSSETTTGPDLLNVVDDALTTARTVPDSAGQLRALAGNQPVYLCWL